MRAIVINPWDQSITEIEHDGDYKKLYPLLSGPTLEGLPEADVSCFDIVRLGDNGDHIMYVDDCGHCVDHQAYFEFANNTIIAGRGVILRNDDVGDDRSATLSIKKLHGSIRFLPLNTVYTPPPPTVQSFATDDAFYEAMAKIRDSITPCLKP